MGRRRCDTITAPSTLRPSVMPFVFGYRTPLNAFSPTSLSPLPSHPSGGTSKRTPATLTPSSPSLVVSALLSPPTRLSPPPPTPAERLDQSGTTV